MIFFAKGPIEYEYFFNRSIWPINRTVTGTTTPGQSGTRSNGNEGELNTLVIFRTGASP